MYIEISDAFVGALKTAPSEDMWTSLDYAMYAAKEGRHVVSCESRVCAKELVLLAKKNKKRNL